MEYIIRQIKPEEYYLLSIFLYEAIFIPDGEKAPDKSIINQPELQIYISGFGTKKMIYVLWQKLMGILQVLYGCVI